MGKGPNCGVGGFYSGGIDEISGRREKYVICAGEDLILSQRYLSHQLGRNGEQYEVEIEDADGEVVREIFYGKLELILEFEIPDEKFWGDLRGTIALLAVITPCVTMGKDAAKMTTTYQHTTTQVVTDLRTISSVIG